MKVAVIGSRGITDIPLADYLPPDTTVLISGGARGVDQCAQQYADAHRLPILVFRPDYARYRKGAPLYRNRQIVNAADFILAFWDGHSSGTRQAIQYARAQGKPLRVVTLPDTEKGKIVETG